MLLGLQGNSHSIITCTEKAHELLPILKTIQLCPNNIGNTAEHAVESPAYKHKRPIMSSRLTCTNAQEDIAWKSNERSNEL